MEALGQQPGNRQGGRDGKLANGQRNQGGDQASEGQQQKCEGRGNHQTLGAPHIIGARFPNVKIQRKLARQFELYVGITAPQFIRKSAGSLVKLGNERLHWTVGRREAHQNKRPASLAEENRIAQLEMGNDSGDAGFFSQSRHDGCQRLLAFLGIRGREALNHQDDAIHEWRAKTAYQLLPDSFRFAALDTGCRLQMALGVKREWKKRYDGAKDYTGHPETAHMHETHDVIQNRRSEGTLTSSAGIEGL